jgi:Na+/H+ antiporter NhaA
MRAAYVTKRFSLLRTVLAANIRMAVTPYAERPNGMARTRPSEFGPPHIASRLARGWGIPMAADIAFALGAL